MANIQKSEICCVCGLSVTEREGLFINRVPEFNDLATRIDIGRKFPKGDWVCRICDSTDSDGVLHDLDNLECAATLESMLFKKKK